MEVLVSAPDTVLYTNESLASFSQRKKRVAGYVRVSTDDPEQETSLELQKQFFIDLVASNPDWELSELYIDDGYSGSHAKKRPAFSKMVKDAEAGKIDIIWTKSVSRFGRNVRETSKYIPYFDELGVEIIFDEQGLSSKDPNGKLILQILVTLAEYELRSFSENIRWTQQKNREEGKVIFSYNYFLGYKKDDKGKLVIVPEEAEIVKMIYDKFLDHYTLREIAEDLTNKNIPTPAKKQQWYPSTVRSILSNEKYKGDAILQKTFKEDVLSDKIFKNNGEKPMYYIKDNHPAIIDPDMFDYVQALLKRKGKKHATSDSSMQGMIICGDCGYTYGRKKWKSGNKKKTYVTWRCNARYKYGNKNCSAPVILEEQIVEGWLLELNKILENKEKYIEDKTKELKTIETTLKEEKLSDKVYDAYKSMLDAKQNFFHYTELNLKAEIVRSKQILSEKEEEYNILDQKRLELIEKIFRLKKFLELVQNSTGRLEDFDKAWWYKSVIKVVARKDSLIYYFCDGSEKITSLAKKELG